MASQLASQRLADWTTRGLMSNEAKGQKVEHFKEARWGYHHEKGRIDGEAKSGF